MGVDLSQYQSPPAIIVRMSDNRPTRIDLTGAEVPIEGPVVSAAPGTGAGTGAVPAASGIASGFNFMSANRLSVMVPAGAYHFKGVGQHVDGFNETRNYGLGIAAQISPDVEGFVTAYRSSYADMFRYKGDVAVVAGANWDPLKVDMGPLHLKAGLMAGVAYTTQGSYADAAPQLSAGKFTALAGLHGEMTHHESGIGVGATVLPSIGRGVGVAALYLKKTF